MIDKVRALTKNSLARNVLASGMLKPVSMLISYIYVPIALGYLGVEKYGAWSVVLSVLSWISYFDIGIGNGLRSRLTEALVQKDADRAGKLVSSAYVMLAKVVGAAMAAMISVSVFLDWSSLLGLKEHDRELKAAVIFSMIFVSINFVLSLCKSVMFAMQMAAMTSVLEVCVQLINLVGVLIASCFTGGSFLVVSLISGLSSLITTLVFTVLLYMKHKELMPSRKKSDRAAGREVTSLGLRFFVIQISGLILFTTDSLIISVLYGAEDVTPYSIVNKIFTAMIVLHSAMLAPFWSAASKAKAEHDIAKVKRMVRYNIYLMIPFAVGAVCAALVFRPVTALWLGQELAYTDGLIWLGAFYSVVYIWCNTFGIIGSGLDVIRSQMVIAIVQAVINIPLSLMFAVSLDMRSTGIMLGTVSSMLVCMAGMPIAVMLKIRRLENEECS